MPTITQEFAKGRLAVHKETKADGTIIEGPDSEARVLWKKSGTDKPIKLSVFSLDAKFGPGERVVYREDGKRERLGTIFEDVLKICGPDEVLVMFDGFERVVRKKIKELALVPIAVA